MARIDDGDLNVQGRGRVTIGPAGGRESQTISYDRLIWRPPVSHHPNLPDGFTIPLACWTSPDGLRRWFLEELLTHERPIDEVIGRCFLGGLEILRGAKGLSDQEVFSYRLMSLLFSRRVHFQSTTRGGLNGRAICTYGHADGFRPARPDAQDETGMKTKSSALDGEERPHGARRRQTRPVGRGLFQDGAAGCPGEGDGRILRRQNWSRSDSMNLPRRTR